VIALLLACALRPARADDLPPGQASVRVFAGADGLRNLAITNIIQDRDGFLWIGTDDGVYRFDGERFTHYGAEDGLIANLIFVVGLDPSGRPCIGSSNGVVCWQGRRFSRVRGLPATRVNTLASHAGRLWIGTETEGLWVQDGDRFVPAPGWRGARSIVALWADADGLLVGDGATVQHTSGDGAWGTLGDVGLGPERVDELLRDRGGALWIRTVSHLWLVPRGRGTAVDLRAGLPSNYDATGMVIGPRGDVLVATDRGLAYRDGDAWRTIALSGGKGVASAIVRALFVDREGTIWIASAGLIQLRGRGIIEHHDEASGLPGDTVWSYARDPAGALWIGTNRCLVHAVDRRWQCLPGSEGRVVRAAVFPPGGGVFLGGAPSDLRYIAPDGKVTVTAFDHPADHVILSLALGPEGDLWVGTRAGLYRVRGALPGGPLERVALPGAHPDSRVPSLRVVDGRLWTGTLDGVLVLDAGQWRLFDQRAGFRDTSMRYVVPRGDGRLCAAYSEPLGVSCFRYEAGAITRVEHVGPAEGLTSGKVYLVGEDARGRLWVGTGDGIDVITERGGHRVIDHLDERDGLAGNDSSAMAFLADADGSLWLGATGGATHVLAQHYDGPPAPPRLVFVAGRLGERAFADFGAALEVPHDSNTLNVAFTSSSMLDAKRIEYEVRLSPLEAEWSASRQHDARYPALLPGSYTLEVRARIGRGAWGEASALRFTILPAWWQTSWFVGASGLVGLIAIAAACGWWLRRRTRQLHARAEASFRAVIDLMPDLISVHRDDGATYLNEADRRFLGLDGPGDEPDGGWTDADVLDRVHPDDRAACGELLRRVRAGTQLASDVVELRMRGADASWRICEVSGIRVEIAGAATVVTSARDVTERKRMRAKLLVSDRMASLGTLAAGIAHEINNPLAYVTGNLEAVAELLASPGGPRSEADRAERAELASAIHDARDGADRVRKIVLGLRSFSRGEEEDRVALALPGVLEAAIRLTGNEVRHRAQLVRELAPTPLVVADDGRLTQVFINLLINAAHAIPEGRSDANRITVRTKTADDGRAVIEIADTGKGIAPDALSRVFDPFFTTKEVGEGTGLGLSICHGIISGLGGTIALDSAVGRGTTVRVVLPPAPVQPQARAAEVAEPAPPPPARRPRVLLVDDEPLVAQTMERLLRKDYEVAIATCGSDALAAIAAGAWFDAIISDVMMPNMTGLELLDELRRVAPAQAARLIFLSGGAFTAQTRERLADLGVEQLEKPVTAKQLRASVSRLTAEARLAS
jgi:PAS domain S-box-containing protein